MLHCLCGPPSIPLSFSLAAVFPRRDTSFVIYGTGRVDTPDISCPSFTARTTRVSNPVCSPSFRASASVLFQRAAFATGVPPDIYAFHRYTRNSTLLSQTLAYRSPLHAWVLAPMFHIGPNRPPTRSLLPIIPDNACHLRI